MKFDLINLYLITYNVTFQNLQNQIPIGWDEGYISSAYIKHYPKSISIQIQKWWSLMQELSNSVFFIVFLSLSFWHNVSVDYVTFANQVRERNDLPLS